VVKRVRNTVGLIIGLGVLLRLIVVFWSAFYCPIISINADAMAFHNNAVLFSKSLDFDAITEANLYSYWLGFIYHFTSESVLVGNLLSIVAWMFSAYVLKHIMNMFLIGIRYQCIIMLLYSTWPSSILFTSITLREAYQLLFVNLSFLLIIKFYIQRKSIHLLLAFLPLAILCMLHVTFKAFSFFFLFIAICLFNMRQSIKLNVNSLTRLWAPTVLVALSLIAWLNYSKYGFNLGLGSAVQSYIERGITLAGEARASYRDHVNIDNVSSFLLYVITAFFQYFLEPLPWRSLSLVDILPIFENALRLFLVYRAYASLMEPKPIEVKSLLIFTLASIFIMELIWSVGTINWGTAMRHHIPSMGLLLVAAFSLNKFLYGSPESNCTHGKQS
jgi:hypothetical protein